MKAQAATIKNDPSKAGQDASKRKFFGEHNRFCVYAVHSRFGDVQWFVTDALTVTDAEVRAGKSPRVIRQEATREEAIGCLTDDTPVFPEFFIPTREQIEAIKVGDLLPDSFGKLAEVVEIRYRGQDQNGKAYVGLVLKWGPTSKITDSLKEGRLHLNVPLTSKFTSHELDMIEAKLLASEQLIKDR